MSGKTNVSRIASCTPSSAGCFRTDSPAQTCSPRSRRKDGSVHHFWRAFTRVEQLFLERVAMHRNLEHWRQLGRRRKGAAALEPRPEPTLDDVRRGYEPSPVNEEDEVTELVGLCLWDIFSDNHDVPAADGRVADTGSFRSAGAFLDEYLTHEQEGWRGGDYMRFYMGTIWIDRFADLTPVYAMIFRRLKAVTPTECTTFRKIGIVELARADDTDKSNERYSVSRAAVAELDAQKRRAVVDRLRAELREAMRVRASRLWTSLACDGMRVPAGVRPRSTRLAAGMNPARIIPFVPACSRSPSSGPRTPRTATDPTLRPLIVRER